MTKINGQTVQGTDTVAKIRVRSGIPLEVNDKGERITIPVEDVQFMEDFYNIIDKFTEAGERVAQCRDSDTKEQLKVLIGECKGIMEELDDLFRDELCRKVFGDIVPTPYAMADFFDQITPIVGTYANERQRKISEKYSKSRQNNNDYHRNYGNRQQRRRRG